MKKDRWMDKIGSGRMEVFGGGAHAGCDWKDGRERGRGMGDGF